MTRWSRRARRTGGDGVDLSSAELDRVHRRIRAAAQLVGGATGAVDRLVGAPVGYLLAHERSDLARHASMLVSLPAHGEVRVVITPGRAPAEWQLEVASRDRPGLLAAFTGVLAGAEIDVVQAVLATWDDGAALEAFVVRAVQPPEPAELQRRFEASLARRLRADAVEDAEVRFQVAPGSPFSSCEVQAGDRPGLLHGIAVAIARAGADVHAARVSTVDGRALDRFDLSDRDGQPITPFVQGQIASLLRSGSGDRASLRAR